MLEVLAQSYNYNTPVTTSSGGGMFTGVFLLLWLVLAVVAIVAMWKVFEKAGVEGWKSIIPIYNSWTLAEIAGKPGWWGLAPLISIIPVLGWIIGPIVTFVVYVIIALELAKRFGKDTMFAVFALIIFSLVGLLILGFGDAKYSGKPFKTLETSK